jgi:GNAT superfamily N-acetyltransferase
MLGLQTDLMIERWSSELLDRGDYLLVRTPAEPDYWMGNSIVVAPPAGGEDGAAWLARWNAVFERELPGAAHRCVRVDGGLDGWTAPGEPWCVERDTALARRAPPQPARGGAAGIDVRPLDGDADWARLSALSIANERDYPVDDRYRAYAAARYRAKRGWVEAGRGLWWGGFDGGELVSALGVVSDGGGLARYQDVMTAESHRGRGVASALIAAAGAEALARGAHTLVIVAVAEGPRRLYTDLGFEPTAVHAHVMVRPPPPSA